MTTTMGNW